jgi:hypothetical protein
MERFEMNQAAAWQQNGGQFEPRTRQPEFAVFANES